MAPGAATKVRQVMTSNPTTIGPDATVAEAMQQMLEKKISGIPVLDQAGMLLGIVTEGDVMRRAELGTERQRPRWLSYLLSPGRLAAEYSRTHGRKVQEIMTRDVVTVTVDASLEEAVQKFEKLHVKRIPVVDGDQLVGVLSRSDLMRMFLSLPQPKGRGDATDATLTRRIQEEMDRQPWCPRNNVRISVVQGVATIDGVVIDERTREALCVLLENIDGVSHVVDHLITVEPISGLIVKTPKEA